MKPDESADESVDESVWQNLGASLLNREFSIHSATSRGKSLRCADAVGRRIRRTTLQTFCRGGAKILSGRCQDFVGAVPKFCRGGAKILSQDFVGAVPRFCRGCARILSQDFVARVPTFCRGNAELKRGLHVGRV